MLSAYLRLAMIVAGLIGATILFAFAFTAAAVVLFVALVVLALLGRPVKMNWWMRRPGTNPDDIFQRRNPFGRQDEPRREPLTIDHDPNDLPSDRR